MRAREMWSIRLHGRGGQGIKTASQILGSAAFYSGFQAQDFPLYGAERRGAPVVAFARISSQAILERGPIIRPDIILIGDETLLDDLQAAPLCGSDESTAIFVNSTRPPQNIQRQLNLPNLPTVVGLTDLSIQHLNNKTILSTALSAVGARMLGEIELNHLLQAVEVELIQLGVASKLLQKNLDLTNEIFQSGSPVRISKRKERKLNSSQFVRVQQKEVAEAAPIILDPGNMILRKTGNWRIERPEIDYEHCNDCLICYARCPDGTIFLRPDGRPEIDYDHCKGCMICALECPGHFIKTVRETGSFP